MSRLSFAFDKNLVPPGYLRFVVHDGTVIMGADVKTWYGKIRKHYADNGYPLPDDYKEIAQDQYCRTCGEPGWCKYENGAGFVGTNVNITLNDLLNGMNVLVAIAKEPDPLVDQETADRRAAICAACPANVFVPGCAPCVGISNLVVGIKGKKTTRADAFLKTCGLCKCSNEAQVWVKHEILMKGTDGATLMEMKRVNGECWKATPR
jgi:hypothetical protein